MRDPSEVIAVAREMRDAAADLGQLGLHVGGTLTQWADRLEAASTPPGDAQPASADVVALKALLREAIGPAGGDFCMNRVLEAAIEAALNTGPEG
jgi:hypothetical protein